MDERQVLKEELIGLKGELSNLQLKIENLELKINNIDNKISLSKMEDKSVKKIGIPIPIGGNISLPNEEKNDKFNDNIAAMEIPKPIIEHNKPKLESVVGTPLIQYVDNNDFIEPNSTPLKRTIEKKESLETNVGKHVMGVLASILIFIGLSSFIVLMLDSMSEVVKMCLMYVFSGGLLGLGLWRNSKKQTGFSTSITACGMGSIYISLFMTLTYFQFINDFVFFILLAVWAIISLILERSIKSSSFNIIGIIGISLSVIMGVFSEPTEIQSVLIVMFFTVFGSLYFIDSIKGSSAVSVTISIINAITSLIVTIFAMDMIEFDATVLGYIGVLMLIVYSLVHFGIITLGYAKKWNINDGASVILWLSVFVNSIIQFTFIGNEVEFLYTTLGALFTFIAFVSYIIIAEYSNKNNLCSNLIRYMVTIPSLIVVTIFWFILFAETNMYMFGLLPIFGSLLIYGLKYNVKSYVLLSNILLSGYSIMLFFTSLFEVSYNSLEYTYIVYIISHIILFIGTQFIFRKDDFYEKFKSINLTVIGLGIATLVYLLSEAYTSSEYLGVFGLVVVLGIMVLFALLSNYCCKWNSDDLSKQIGHTIYFRILNAILLLVGLTVLCNYSVDEFVYKVCLIIITSIQCFVGVKETLLNRNYNGWSGFYIGLKFTLYLNIVLFSFINYSEFAFICSILCLLLAIISIWFGFNKQIKSFRLYGLYLSIFSVLKLILVDLTYDNSLLRVVGFIGAGILCFVIVWIYNKMSENSNIVSGKDNQYIEE